MALVRDGEAEAASELLLRRMAGRLRRYFERHSVPTDQAEELVSEAILKLISSEYRGETRAIVWVWKVAGSVLLDWVDRQKTLKSGRGAEQGFDDSAWAGIFESVAGSDPPAWLVLCVQRAAFQFERDEPRRSQVLRMCCEGWSAEEVAVYFGAKPPVNDKQKTAARTRMYDATQHARRYFEHCRDET